MNYTLEHLKFVYNAGAKKFPFDQALELITLLGDGGIKGLLGNTDPSAKQTISSTGQKPKARRRRKVQKLPIIVSKGKTAKRRGGLSEKIIGFLSAKGATGAHVKDIAKVIKAPLPSVRIWFYTSGKKHLKSKTIKKVAPATFAYFKPEKSD